MVPLIKIQVKKFLKLNIFYLIVINFLKFYQGWSYLSFLTLNKI